LPVPSARIKFVKLIFWGGYAKKESMSGKITIVIVSFDGLEDLKICLPTVVAINDPEFEILVVDNGSKDGTSDYLSRYFPNVIVEQLSLNFGFAGGNNRGIERAFASGASAVALLNNDTRVNRDWLKGFRKGFASHPAVGICGGKILDWEGRIVEFDGMVFHPNNASGGYVDEPVLSRSGRDDEMRDIAYACGGAMSITRECYEAIDGFDESFFCYNEDVDLGLRAWIQGFRVLFCPTSVTWHRRGSSVRRIHYPGFSDYFGMRNALTTALKNYEWATLRCVWRDLVKIYILSGKKERFRGVLQNIIFLPWTIRKRRIIQRQRLRSDHDIFTRTSRDSRGTSP
jgi:GT2 family glycosyltransferase